MIRVFADYDCTQELFGKRVYFNDVYVGTAPCVIEKANLVELGFRFETGVFGNWRKPCQSASTGMLVYSIADKHSNTALVWVAADDEIKERFMTSKCRWGQALVCFQWGAITDSGLLYFLGVKETDSRSFNQYNSLIVIDSVTQINEVYEIRCSFMMRNDYDFDRNPPDLKLVLGDEYYKKGSKLFVPFEQEEIQGASPLKKYYSLRAILPEHSGLERIAVYSDTPNGHLFCSPPYYIGDITNKK